jgi:hypothetical protein
MLDRTDPIQESRAKRLPAISSPVNPSEREVPHVVVVGGGVAGLILASRRGRSRSKAESVRGPASRRTGQNRSRAEGVARN